MRIAVITATFPPYRGGMGNVAAREAAALAALGHEVTVLTPLYPDQPLAGDAPGAGGAAVHRVRPLLSYGNAAVCPGLRARVRGADVLYLHYPFFGVAEPLCLRARLAGAPPRRARRLVLRYQMDVVGAGVRRLVFAFHTKVVLPAILRAADAVVFSSLDYAANGNAAGFRRAHPERCREVSFGIDATVFHPDPSVTKDPRALLFVGGLDSAHYFKGLEHLLRALPALVRADAGVTLTVVGRGNLLPRYRRLCDELGIARQVRFLTDCDDTELRRCYTAAGVTVLPSVDRSESLGMVLLESLACGTAIAAADLPGVRTLVREGQNGILLRGLVQAAVGGPERPADTIGTALGRLLQDPEGVVRLGQDGLRQVPGTHS